MGRLPLEFGVWIGLLIGYQIVVATENRPLVDFSFVCGLTSSILYFLHSEPEKM